MGWMAANPAAVPDAIGLADKADEAVDKLLLSLGATPYYFDPPLDPRRISFESQRVSSKAKGYYFEVRVGKWYTFIAIKDAPNPVKRVFVGYFVEEHEAAEAYAEAVEAVLEGEREGLTVEELVEAVEELVEASKAVKAAEGSQERRVQGLDLLPFPFDSCEFDSFFDNWLSYLPRGRSADSTALSTRVGRRE
jgi:hypothetical protein